MPRAKGFDKQASERREARELEQFNGRVMREDCQLLRLLLMQEMRRRESPSDRLVNAAEIVDRLEKYLDEISPSPLPLSRGERGKEGANDEKA